MIDKRKSDRLKLPIQIFYSSVSQGPWVGPVDVNDISGGGLSFISPLKLALESQLLFKIVFPEKNNPPIFSTGKVIWLGKSGSCHKIGISFGKMDLPDRKRYVEYLADKILLSNIE